MEVILRVIGIGALILLVVFALLFLRGLSQLIKCVAVLTGHRQQVHEVTEGQGEGAL